MKRGRITAGHFVCPTDAAQRGSQPGDLVQTHCAIDDRPKNAQVPEA